MDSTREQERQSQNSTGRFSMQGSNTPVLAANTDSLKNGFAEDATIGPGVASRDPASERSSGATITALDRSEEMRRRWPTACRAFAYSAS